MSRYLIASDVDRTIIKDYKSDLSKNTKKVIKRLRKDGNIFVIATGRPLFNAKRLFGKWCDYVIGSNGGAIFDIKNKKIIYENCLSKTKCKDIINEIGDNYLKYSICTSKNWNMRIKSKYKLRFREERKIINIDKILNEKIIKFEIYYSTYEELDAALHRIENLGVHVIKVVKGERNGGYLDVFNEGIDKYNALEILLKKEKIDNKHLITFGDNMNDYNMISNAGIGIAVENSDERLKKVAKYITSTSGKEGVYKWLNNYFYNKKN